MSEDTATNFMNVCSRFGKIPKFRNLSRLFSTCWQRQKLPNPSSTKLYALANFRAERAIANGVDNQRLRPEIREATYDEFEKAKGL